MRVIGRLEEPTVHRLLNTLTIMVCLLVMLACGGDTDDRMVRRYAKCLTDTNTTLHRLTVSSTIGTVPLSAEAVEERLRGQLERGELTMGGDQGRLRSLLQIGAGESCGKNAGERRWGGAQSGIKMVPARLNARCAMVATQCVAFGADWMAGETTGGRMMWRIRNREGPKRGDENRRRAGGKNHRTKRFT